MKEEEWVEALRQRFPFSYGVGIGDDAAVVRPGSVASPWVITSDLLVEGVHFRREDLTPQQLALKSLAVNLSDLAAMGAKPLFYTLSLVLPIDFMGDKLKQFYDGLEQGDQRWGVQLAGGDFSAGPFLTIAITAIGEAARPVLRSGACCGDLVAVCGHLGWSKLGMHQLLAGEKQGPYVDAHISVKPLLGEGLTLSQFASAMMDVSDGLLKDLKRLCAASNVGAVVDADSLEPDRDFCEQCTAYKLSPLQTVFGGGEDYALLFTIREENLPKVMEANLHTRIAVVGRIVCAELGVKVIQNGEELRLSAEGFDHFESARD